MTRRPRQWPRWRLCGTTECPITLMTSASARSAAGSSWPKLWRWAISRRRCAWPWPPPTNTTGPGQVDGEGPRVALMQAVLGEEGLTREQLKVKGLREVFFSRGDRAAWCLPAYLTGEVGDDEHNARRKKLTLGFELPRGCYA